MNCIPGLDVYSLLTVDLLHEVELGVWKALFTHIIRMLSAHSPESVHKLDQRYSHHSVAIYRRFNPSKSPNVRFRLIKPFGKDKIRRFSNNASQMKKLAAHHFEDLLQVQSHNSFPINSKLRFYSACSLFWKVCYQNRTTPLYWTLYL